MEPEFASEDFLILLSEWWSERTKIANRNRSDFPSHGPNRKEIPQKEHDFRSDFLQNEIAITSDGNSQL